MKIKPYALVVFSAFFLPGLAQAQVEVKATDSQIIVNVNGKLFTALQKGLDANKPYLWPLNTASGKRVVRSFPMESIPGEPTDHPHQRGVWMGSEHVSGLNIWEIDPADPAKHMGTIQFKNVVETHSGEKSGGFTIVAQWVDQDGKPMIDETLAVTVYAEPVNRVMDITMTWKDLKLATFEDARDGIIGIRFAPPFDEKNGGEAVNAQGLRGANHVEGSRSEWVDWQGTLDGERVGVAVMSHPSNIHSPTAWRAVGFGILFANPFAQRFYNRSLPDGSVGLQPGDELHFRYRYLIHPAGADIAAAYQEFARQ
jgi:Family of unknown function (DUF6807)